MRAVMKIGIAISVLVLTAGSSLGQQSAAPITQPSTGWGFPSLDGNIHYALTASQLIRFGYYSKGAVTPSTAFTGNAAYSSTSEQAPFNMILAGGVVVSESSNTGTTGYVNLAASQGLKTGKWVFGLSDSLSFLPESPTTGVAGYAGVGDIGAVPVDGPVLGPAGGIITLSGSRIGNSISGDFERLLTNSTSISGGAAWGILHFIDGSDGSDSSRISSQLSVNHHLDARDTISVSGVYSVYDYGATENYLTFETKGVNASYSRLLSRTLAMSVSAGPEWVDSNNPAQIPARVITAGNAGLSYSHGLTNASLTYSRGINNGSGVLAGALSNSVIGTISHAYGRDWLVSVSGAYIQTSGLENVTTTEPGSGEIVFSAPEYEEFWTVFGTVQVTHKLGRRSSWYASYTNQHQTFSNTFNGTNAFYGTSQIIGIGITYSPRSTRLGQF
jgi:hypothetical protein